MDKTSKTLSSQVKRKKKWYQEEQQTNKDNASVTRARRVDPFKEALKWVKEDPPGFQIRNFENKGRGVISTIERRRGDFLLNYLGEDITEDEGERREVQPSGYRFFYNRNGKRRCVDATEETGRLGRLVNHGSKKERNSVMKTNGEYLSLFCIRDIAVCEEIMYDYGLDQLPWEEGIKKRKSFMIEESQITTSDDITEGQILHLPEIDSTILSDSPSRIAVGTSQVLELAAKVDQDIQLLRCEEMCKMSEDKTLRDDKWPAPGKVSVSNTPTNNHTKPQLRLAPSPPHTPTSVQTPISCTSSSSIGNQDYSNSGIDDSSEEEKEYNGLSSEDRSKPPMKKGKIKCFTVVQPLPKWFDDKEKEMSASEYVSDSVDGDDDRDEDFRPSGDSSDSSDDLYDSETSEVIEADTGKTAERHKTRLPMASTDLSSLHEHYHRVQHSTVGGSGTDSSQEPEDRQTTVVSGSQIINTDTDTGSRTEESDKVLSKQRIRALFRDIRIENYTENNGKRNYSKMVYGPVCTYKYISKISSHLLTVHPNDRRVRNIRDMPLGSTQRKMALQKLQNEGNFQHNTEVLAKGEGLFIICRRSRNENKAWEYVPCEFCLGFYHEKQIWTHAKSCYHRSAQVDSTANYLRNGRAMMSPFLIREDKDFEYLDEVISKMKETTQNPGLKGVCYEDEIIREFGIHQLDRLGTEQEQRKKDLDNVRTKMRSVGRLLMKLNEQKMFKQPLNFFINAQQFMNVVQAVKEVSRKSSSPQLAVCLGGYIKQIGLLKKSLGRIQSFW